MGGEREKGSVRVAVDPKWQYSRFLGEGATEPPLSVPARGCEALGRCAGHLGSGDRSKEVVAPDL